MGDRKTNPSNCPGVDTQESSCRSAEHIGDFGRRGQISSLRPRPRGSTGSIWDPTRQTTPRKHTPRDPAERGQYSSGCTGRHLLLGASKNNRNLSIKIPKHAQGKNRSGRDEEGRGKRGGMKKVEERKIGSKREELFLRPLVLSTRSCAHHSSGSAHTPERTAPAATPEAAHSLGPQSPQVVRGLGRRKLSTRGGVGFARTTGNLRSPGPVLR